RRIISSEVSIGAESVAPAGSTDSGRSDPVSVRDTSGNRRGSASEADSTEIVDALGASDCTGGGDWEGTGDGTSSGSAFWVVLRAARTAARTRTETNTPNTTTPTREEETASSRTAMNGPRTRNARTSGRHPQPILFFRSATDGILGVSGPGDTPAQPPRSDSQEDGGVEEEDSHLFHHVLEGPAPVHEVGEPVDGPSMRSHVCHRPHRRREQLQWQHRPAHGCHTQTDQHRETTRLLVVAE